MRDLVVLLAWIALIPVAFTRPFVSVMLWDWTAFLAPNTFVYGFLIGVPFNKIVAGITVIALLVSPEPKKIHWNSTLTLIFILLAQGTVSYLLSGNNTAAPDIFDKFWKECSLCLLIAITTTTRLRFHCMLGISAIALGFHGVVEGLKVILSGGQHHIQSIGTFGDNNQGALALLMIIPVLHYLSQQSVNRTVKYTYLVALVINTLAVVGTWSRGGFLGLAVLAIALVALSRNKIRSLALICMMGATILFAASAQYYDRLETLETTDADTSFMGRVLAWEVSFAIARAHPFFGEGFHGVQDPQIWHAYVSKVYIPQAVLSAGIPKSKAAHSIYFEVMGDLGFVGLALFLALLLCGFYNISKVSRFAKSKPELRWIYDLGIMFRLILLVYCTAGAGVSMAWFEFSFVTLTLISILVRFCHEIEAVPIGELARDQDTSGARIRRPDVRPVVARQRL